MNKTILLLGKLMLVGLLMLGCSTDNGSNCPEALTGELTLDELDFVGTWVFTDLVSEKEVDLTDDNVDNPSTDIFSQLEACDKDVDYVFRSDRTYTVRQEYNAQDCDNKLSFDGTWKYANGELTLVTPDICLSQTLDITLNSDTEFTVTDQYTFNEVSGLTLKSSVTLTFTKS